MIKDKKNYKDWKFYIGISLILLILLSVIIRCFNVTINITWEVINTLITVSGIVISALMLNKSIKNSSETTRKQSIREMKIKNYNNLIEAITGYLNDITDSDKQEKFLKEMNKAPYMLHMKFWTV